MITPREIIRDYLSVLNILLQNPDAVFSGVMNGGAVTLAHDGRTADGDTDSVPVASAVPAEAVQEKQAPFRSGVKMEDIEI